MFEKGGGVRLGVFGYGLALRYVHFCKNGRIVMTRSHIKFAELISHEE